MVEIRTLTQVCLKETFSSLLWQLKRPQQAVEVPLGPTVQKENMGVRTRAGNFRTTEKPLLRPTAEMMVTRAWKMNYIHK